jgi:hypothetical protein
MTVARAVATIPIISLTLPEPISRGKLVTCYCHLAVEVVTQFESKTGQDWTKENRAFTKLQ